VPVPPEPKPAEVRVFVTSNVPAEVVDPADATVLGPTGDGGIVLTAGAAPRKVVVRATGYEDHPLELAATEGTRYTADLKPKKKTVPRQDAEAARRAEAAWRDQGADQGGRPEVRREAAARAQEPVRDARHGPVGPRPSAGARTSRRCGSTRRGA
jgi:hypothetical protein